MLRPRRRIPVALIAILVMLFGAGGDRAGAQDVAVRAYLTPSAVGVGRTFVLNLEISGTQSVDSEPQLPDLSAFASYLGSGSSTNMQIINGRTSVSLTIQYRYQALQEGTFQVPAITVSVGGERHTTEPLQLTVAAGQPPDPGRTGGQPDATEISSEDLFLTAQASKTRVREGEPLVVEYRIFTRVDVSSYSFTSVPEPQGFWAEELPLPDGPQVEQVTREGVQYASAVIRRVALVPTGPGERTVDPLGLEAQVRVRRRGLDPFEDFFNMDRSALFGTVVPAGVVSNPLRITVDPLPLGRPEPFSGVVGDLELVATLDQDSVEANEAVTLTLTARGRGNMRAIPEPTLDLPTDFEVYPPEVSESVQRSGPGLEGSKSWRYVLIPRAPGRRSVPAIAMGFYDTGEEAYRTATTVPLPLTVTGELLEGPAAGVRGGVANLREDIRFIHLGPAGLRRSDGSPFGGWGFWALFLLPAAAVLGSLALRKHQDRLEGDPAYARQRKAGRVAKKRLARARGMAGGDAPREFYAEVARALRGLVADKLNMAEAGMRFREVTETLKERGASEKVIQEISSCLDHCDRQRFAPPETDAREEARFLERVAGVMTDLNREVRR
jgi:hypothetical protein